MVSQQYGPNSTAPDLANRRGRAQRAAVSQLREDHAAECANSMAEYQGRNSLQLDMCHAKVHMAVSMKRDSIRK